MLRMSTALFSWSGLKKLKPVSSSENFVIVIKFLLLKLHSVSCPVHATLPQLYRPSLLVLALLKLRPKALYKLM